MMRRHTLLTGVLTLAMVFATVASSALSVLSRPVIEEFGISRSELGLLFTAISMVGALGAPGAGRLADAVGGRRVLAGLFGAAGLSLVAMAGAPGYPWLVAGSLGAGLALAAGNPTTNKIIAVHLPSLYRGSVIGVKQAGPPLGLFAAGAVLPAASAAMGWRGALAVVGALGLAGTAAVIGLVPLDPPGRELAAGPERPSLDAPGHMVRWLIGIGFAVSTGLAAVLAFLPLYAQEEAGMSVAGAGMLAAVVGVVGVAARVVWGWQGRRFRHATTPLAVIGVLSVGASLAIWFGPLLGVGLLWAGAVAAGASMMAWHALGWLALVDEVGPRGVGGASGVVHLGSGVGFALGPPAFGAVVDASGSYGWGWGLVTLVLGAAWVATLAWRRSVRMRAALATLGDRT